MPEIRFKADAQTIDTIGTYIGDHRGTQVCQASLAFMEWAVNEMRNGRQIQAVNEEGNAHEPIFFFSEQKGGE